MLRLGLALTLLCGCPHPQWRGYPPVAIETPVPIAGINSAYDDFNSAMITPPQELLIFSTNRGSQGKHYDLYKATLRWATIDETQPSPVVAEEPKPFLPELMSEGNERGPILIDGLGSRQRLVFATDRPGGQGGLDLVNAECDDGCKYLRPLWGLNSSADDAYLSRPFVDRELPYTGRKLLFASNRADAKHNDIYAAIWDYRDTVDAAPRDIERVDELSSPADDTAPFVYERARGDIEVVFVSARAGSLGEHDLYCARFADMRTEEERAAADARRVGPWDYREWSEPVHLRTISSERDEYRPIVVDVKRSRYLIFSSTRAGGQGGYDLYIVSYAGCPTP